MNRDLTVALLLFGLIAGVLGLIITGVILLAVFSPYYLAILAGLILYIGVPLLLVVIPAIGIMAWIVSTLVGGVTIGWVVRRYMTPKGCLIATTAGLVSGGSFVILMIFNLVVAALY